MQPAKRVFERLLSAAADRATVQLPHTDASTVALEVVRSFANFLCLGVKHILTGYDHLLFLFGLLLVARGFFSSLGIITSFTIAHSITLAVATLHLVQIPSRIVEPLDRCFHRFCWHREPFARRHSNSAANGAFRLWFDTWLWLCFGFA